ncbi:MAG: hypothetical protein JWO45_2019, partial [Spartobacteria bacterium]|nr:hypothetical protein [Spartobacteria bacterium]
PMSAPAIAVTEKVTRGQGLIEDTGMMQRERHSARTIVTGILKRSMSSTPMIRLSPNRVHRPNRGFDVGGSIRRCVGDAASQNRAISRHGGTFAVMFDFRSRLNFAVEIIRFRMRYGARRVVRDLHRGRRTSRRRFQRERLQRNVNGSCLVNPLSIDDAMVTPCRAGGSRAKGGDENERNKNEQPKVRSKGGRS